MFKTIVVGLDGSDGAKHAMEYAVELARRDGAGLVLAHVEQEIVGKGGGPIQADEPEVQAEIDRRAKELSSEGVETRVEKSSIFVGGPGAVLARIADEEEADLIVVGTRGHGAAAGVILGSVAHRLLHLASQPVLVVPESARLRAGSEATAAAAGSAGA